MIRESELADMEKKWKADNEKIMREHPLLPSPPEPKGQEDWPAKDDTVYGEPWPEPTDIAPKPAPPRRTVRANDNRPKAPPRRVGATVPSAAAPPIPAKAASAPPPTPATGDEGA
jgi:sec-independent protein translocase protein TatB